MRQRRAKAILGGTMAVGLVFIVAGAAFACTKYYGQITGSGNGSGDSPTTVAGDPDAGVFQWCGSPPGFSGTSDATREAFWGTKVDATAAELTITVEAATTCLQGTTGTNVLPQGTYKVGISEGYWDETDEGFAEGDEDNCHTLETSSGAGYGTVIDTGFSVNSSGFGTQTYDDTVLEASGVLRDAVGGAGGWNTVCVYWPQGSSLVGDYFNPANALNFRSL